jgi:hypothetical protein
MGVRGPSSEALSDLSEYSKELVQRFVSPFQVKLRVAGKGVTQRGAVQMAWDAG